MKVLFSFSVVVVLTASMIANVSSSGYVTPIVCMHGLNCSAEDCDNLGKIVAQEHPGQPFYSLQSDPNGDSFKNMFEQVVDIQAEIRKLINDHPAEFKNGFHFVGHSQGGLLARTVIEESDDFQIKHFLSLAGVQAGEFVLRIVFHTTNDDEYAVITCVFV